MESSREKVSVRGIVQGVGFRPFVSRLARQFDLVGWVRNTSDGVSIEVQGPRDSIERFALELERSAPPQSCIIDITREDIEAIEGETEFEILASPEPSVCKTLISPDLATCGECLMELRNPSDRRWSYPFINCTNCGPRFSIILDIPYDRPFTTMRTFHMCPDCESEYHDPRDRRFHAQPNACPVCGPRIFLFSLTPTLSRRERGKNSQEDRRTTPAVCEHPAGKPYNAGHTSRHEKPSQSCSLSPRERVGVREAEPTIEESVRHLAQGAIVAIKGIGGFHLACDATNRQAVERLRQRKGRGNKPLALMVPDLQSAEELASLSPTERKHLQSVQAPILLVQPRPDTELRRWIAPDTPRLGIMLPYSPLHHLLGGTFGRPLVMTSGNLSEEPLAYEPDDALARLGNIADVFLLHDRPIARPCDDSVGVVWRNRLRLLRRSRGFAPRPLALPQARGLRPYLCVGADLKNTFCLVSPDGLAFPSQHIGDLETPESQNHFRNTLRDLCKLLDLQPEAVVMDPHPDYHSVRLAESLYPGIPSHTVQHHKAHFAGCLAENGHDGPAIGISWDGTGYGLDGRLWGGEFFVGDAVSPRRAATFRAVRLPGGEQAIHQPWRAAYSILRDLFGETVEDNLPHTMREIPQFSRRMVGHLLERDLHSPRCTSVGRLFDAVASLAGLRHTVTYEAEAAVALEACCTGESGDAYPYEIVDSSVPWEIDTRPLFRVLLRDVLSSVGISAISSRFHLALALICREICCKLRIETGLDIVALSGGVFQNLVLLEQVTAALEDAGFSVLTHSEIPANDGGIGFGQAAAAAARWKACVWQSP